jgi:hypothetical protein
MNRIWMAAVALGLCLSAVAQKRPGEAVTLEKTEFKGEVKAGTTATAVLHFKIEKGFHTHSHQPSESNFIATVVSIPPTNGVMAGKITYPEGKAETVEGLSKPLSLYEGEFKLEVPIKVDATATLPATVPGTLTYQACKGATCYPPKKLKFDLVLK